MSELIVVKQLPIIEARIKEISASVLKKTEEAAKLVVAKESKWQAKKIRAELSKEREELEGLRKTVKKEVLAPYEHFEELYREKIFEPYMNADRVLKEKIGAIESAEIEEKWIEIKAYFDELAESLGIDFFTFEESGVKINLSTTIPACKRSVKEELERLAADIASIETMENSAVVLAEWKANGYSLGDALRVLNERAQRVQEEEQRAIALAEAKAQEAQRVEAVEATVQAVTTEETTPQAIEAPSVEEPTLTATFKVTATKAKLIELKQFLENGGYDYE